MPKICLAFGLFLASTGLGSGQQAFQCRIDPFPLAQGSPGSRAPFEEVIESKPCFGDLDGDGDLDLLIGTFEGNIRFYRNSGSAKKPLFELEAEQLGAIDVGLHCSPSLADLDGDGDLDLLAGESDGNINFYRNAGSAEVPHFELESESFGSVGGGLRSTPALADLDGDGNLDLVVGDFWGRLKLYRNNGSAGQPSFELAPQTLASIQVEFHSAPALADYDGDGDLDLFVGERGGKVKIYLNSGTARSAVFARQSLTLAPVDAQLDSHPAFADIDGDNRLDLIVGRNAGVPLLCRSAPDPPSAERRPVPQAGTELADLGAGLRNPD